MAANALCNNIVNLSVKEADSPRRKC